MNMAKASEQDMSAALLLCGILMDVENGHFPRDINGELPKSAYPDDDCYFDADNKDHLQEFYKLVTACMEMGGIHRVIWGMHTIMHNDVIDPDNDVLSLHPRIVKALTALDLIETRMPLNGNHFIREEAK